jgi:hypothetical protein
MPNGIQAEFRCPQKALARRPGRKKERKEVCSALLGCRDYLVKFGWVLLVLGEDNVDLSVGGNEDDDTTVRIKIHDLGVARCADVLGQPLPEHIVLGKGRTRIVLRYLG